MPSRSNSPAETRTPYTVARDHLRAFRLYSQKHSNAYTLLKDLHLLEFAIIRMRAQLVHGLRDEGATWREIGEALGLTESQARHQYTQDDGSPNRG